MNFIRGFVRYMPSDFEAEIVGIAVGEDHSGSGWREITLAGRGVRFLPVARMPQARRSGRLPTKARIVAGMLRHRARIATAGRVAQIHAPAMDLSLLGRQVPTVRVVHNAPRDLATNRGESAWRRFAVGLYLAERLTFRRSSLVYFVNQKTYDEYAEAMTASASSMRYLPNFVDTSSFLPRFGEERSALRKELGNVVGVDPGAPWLLFAGRLDPQKDPLLALRSFVAAIQSDPTSQARLLIAGDGTLRVVSERAVTEAGIVDRVAFTGTLPQETLAKLMSVADAFLLTSSFEAGPTVAYEALASGLPVVSTAVGEVPRLVRHGETGWLVGSADPAQLGAGILWALSRDRAVAAEACARSMAPYHLETVLKAFYDEHRRLALGELEAMYDGDRPDRSTESP
ncbi:MAG TPA: glycosyltransferase family 4 protein [Candidatus Limnocylindria bacterium]|nr:glycosyltransferase family 4 protein [Candidatus Limnocylindria bacterium]